MIRVTRYHLTRDGKRPEESIFRAQAVLLAKWATADEADPGEPVGSIVYRFVTESRHYWAQKWRTFYSSCGDLATFVLASLGCGTPDDPWINRGPFAKGAVPRDGEWGIGENISDLQNYAPAWQAHPKAGEFRPEPGDIVCMGNDPKGRDAHIFVIGEVREDDYVTYDYGQPGGARRIKTMTSPSDPDAPATIAGKRVLGWLPLWRHVQAVSALGRLRDALIPEGCAVADGAVEVPRIEDRDTDEMEALP